MPPIDSALLWRLRPALGPAPRTTFCPCRRSDVAIGNVVPAPETLPPDIEDHDRRSWFARILREMEGLKPLGFTPALQAAYDDLRRRLQGG